MDYQTPKQARLEHIKGYQRLVQYYKEQISHFDEEPANIFEQLIIKTVSAE